MSKNSNYNCLDVGDKVRVRQSGGKAGPTLYEIVEKDPTYKHRVMIREVGTAPNGKPYAAQLFDASLLMLERSGEGPELLARYFSFGAPKRYVSSGKFGK